MRKRKFVRYAVVISILLLSLGETAIAAMYGANAGIIDSAGLLKDSANSAMPAGNLVEYIHLKTGVIYGPVDSNGAVDAQYETVTVGTGTPDEERKSGYDSTQGNRINPEPTAGKFFHQTNVSADSPQVFIVRAWDLPIAGSTARFGESIVFSSQSNPMSPPPDVRLPPFSTIFPKAVPAAPAYANGFPQAIQGSGAQVPRLQIKFNTVLGARNFQAQLSRSADYTGPFIDDSSFYKDNYHSLYAGNESAFDKTYNLAQTDQLKKIYYRVRAINSFGPSAWAEGNVDIPENADPYVPFPVTDLTAKAVNGKIVLRWTAPYDRNKSGDAAPCVAYDIRVSTEAIIAAPQEPLAASNTNAGGIDTWATAIPLTDGSVSLLGFSAVAALPAPALFGATELLTIEGAVNQTCYFALKSRDGIAPQGNVSYVSNIAGVGISAASNSLTFDLKGSDPNKLVVNIITIPPAMIETGAGSPATAPALTASGVRASTTAMTASALITKINSQAPRADNVIVVSTWDRETGKPLGYKANGEGTNFVLKPGMGCQVYVKQDMTLTLP